MIFFCEECGDKNDLEKADIQNGRAVFRCCSCQYMNSYTYPNGVKKTDTFLKKIQSHPEIIGAFLYHGQNRIITNHMPGTLTTADLEVLGRYLSRSYLMAQSHYPDVYEAMITISDKHITIQNIGADLFLFVVSKSCPLPQKIKKLVMSAKGR